jgi:hypothetical protein
MRFFAPVLLIALCAPVAVGAENPQPRKDAAEAVGEGNAARWLEYYRRERGEAWAPPPPTDAAPEKPSSERAKALKPQVGQPGAGNPEPRRE